VYFFARARNFGAKPETSKSDLLSWKAIKNEIKNFGGKKIVQKNSVSFVARFFDEGHLT
jgi:hypothetical protein